MQFKPYLLDAYMRWFGDCGVTPMLGVAITPACQLPRHLMDQKEVWLNVGAESTRNFSLNEHGVFFQTRFNQVVHDVFIPWESAQAIRAKEWPFAAQLPELLPPGQEAPEVPNVDQQKVLNLRGRDTLSPEQPTEPPKAKPVLRLVVSNETVTKDPSSPSKKPSLHRIK